jgi:predicted membrane-bound mannosyltransferase
MSSRDFDREIARLFEAQRQADEASAPAFRELLARPRARRAPLEGWIWRPALAAAAVVVVAAVLTFHRPARPAPPANRTRTPESALPAAAAALAAWKAPTDFLLETPGADLLTRVPALVHPAPETTPAFLEDRRS